MTSSDEVNRLREENAHLRALLERSPPDRCPIGAGISPPGESHRSCARTSPQTAGQGAADLHWEGTEHQLTKDQVVRYSRQVILPSFGAQAQSRLCNSSVLVVGAGGLGSPVAMYLAAAGVGRLGLADHDAVELNNLHRQIAHRESTVGIHKCDSAGLTCRSINSSIQVELYRNGFTQQNALELVCSFDFVVDATDNAPSRYLISDACVLAGKPLVSGAAIGTDGQLTVYNHGPDGPCYRCLFPEAPEPQSCSRCSDAGVLGVVPGIIGSLQALEAIKLATGVGKPLSRSLLLFDGLAGRFTSVKLRQKMPSCIVCGTAPQLTAQTLLSYPYATFTGAPPHDAGPAALELLAPIQRIKAAELQEWIASDSVSIVDVRPEAEFGIAHIPGSTNLPFIERKPQAFDEHIEQLRQRVRDAAIDTGDDSLHPAVCVICRRGNDSQRVVRLLVAHGVNDVVDLAGGLEAWARESGVDFPHY